MLFLRICKEMNSFVSLLSRNRIREERVQQARELENKGKKEEARRVMAQSAQITFDVVKGLIKVSIKTFRNSVVELA